MTEEWKNIPGYEGMYMVSNLGRIKSLSRLIRIGAPSQQTSKERFLSLRKITNCGYIAVSLTKNRTEKTINIHRLVTLAFLGPCPVGIEVCHRNGIKTDNRLENLRYDTRSANKYDMKLNGTFPEGEKSPSTKLKKYEVLEIIRLKRLGIFNRVISSMFKISTVLIGQIYSRKAYRWVKV